jgi:TRAP-type transport system periplasmic protein
VTTCPSHIHRRTIISGLGSALALRGAPAIAQTAPKKMILAHNGPPPESSATAYEFFAKQLTARSKGEIDVDFRGGTLLTKEIDIINAVKSGNIALGSPVGAASTLFPELGVFLVPYLVSSYAQGYRILNGEVGDQLDKLFQQKYGVKVMFFNDSGFRHIWNSRRPVHEPSDLRGLKIRVQPAKIFAEGINALGGVAVPMAWSEVITGAQQGVIDGGDLPVFNIIPLKVYEVTKYFSLTYHSYSPSFLAMNMAVWNGLRPDQQKLALEIGREAQGVMRNLNESVDSLDGAKKLLEPKGLPVNAANVPAFKKLVQEKMWPTYQKQYPEMWEKITSTPA